MSVYAITGFLAGLAVSCSPSGSRRRGCRCPGLRTDRHRRGGYRRDQPLGGEGSVLGTLVGTLLIGVLKSGLAINNVNPYYQPIIIGLIGVFSVYLDRSLSAGGGNDVLARPPVRSGTLVVIAGQRTAR